MAKDIEIPSFVNYTDLRQKQEISDIEEETIRNYAKGLNSAQMQIFLSEVPYHTLMEECSRKYYSDHTTLKNIRKFM